MAPGLVSLTCNKQGQKQESQVRQEASERRQVLPTEGALWMRLILHLPPADKAQVVLHSPIVNLVQVPSIMTADGAHFTIGSGAHFTISSRIHVF